MSETIQQKLKFVESFTTSEVEQLKKAFEEADANHDHFLQYDEFAPLLNEYINVEEQMKDLFRVFDVNQDGKIDINEFLSALAVSIHGTPQQKLELIFALYDVDRNNVLMPDEVAKVLKHLKSAADKLIEQNSTEDVSSDFANSVIKKLDLNQDGKITLEEWVNGGLKIPALLCVLGINI